MAKEGHSSQTQGKGCLLHPAGQGTSTGKGSDPQQAKLGFPLGQLVPNQRPMQKAPAA